MRNENKITSIIKAIFLTFVLVAGVQVSAIDWTPPSSSPVGGNTPAPLNEGVTGQTKAGGLILGTSLTSTQAALTLVKGKFIYTPDGTTPPPNLLGKVLTSDANGVASWAAPSGGGLTPGANNQTLRYNSTTAAWEANNNILNNGTQVLIGGTTDFRDTTLHVRNPNNTTAVRISKLANSSGDSTLQLYKGNIGTWSGWSLLNNPSGDFRLNYDRTEGISDGDPAIFIKGVTKKVGIGMRPQGADYAEQTGNSLLSVGGKILVDLTGPRFGTAESDYRDGFEMIVGGCGANGPCPDKGRFIINKSNFEFWNKAANNNSGARAGLLVGPIDATGSINNTGNITTTGIVNAAGNITTAGVMSAQYIKLKPSQISVPTGKVLTSVGTGPNEGDADWKYVGAVLTDTLYPVSNGRADCPPASLVPGTGKVVTGISVNAQGEVTGVYCKALGPL